MAILCLIDRFCGQSDRFRWYFERYTIMLENIRQFLIQEANFMLIHEISCSICSIHEISVFRQDFIKFANKFSIYREFGLKFDKIEGNSIFCIFSACNTKSIENKRNFLFFEQNWAQNLQIWPIFLSIVGRWKILRNRSFLAKISQKWEILWQNELIFSQIGPKIVDSRSRKISRFLAFWALNWLFSPRNAPNSARNEPFWAIFCPKYLDFLWFLPSMHHQIHPKIADKSAIFLEFDDNFFQLGPKISAKSQKIPHRGYFFQWNWKTFRPKSFGFLLPACNVPVGAQMPRRGLLFCKEKESAQRKRKYNRRVRA